MHFAGKIFDFGGRVCGGVVEEVVYWFLQFLIVPIDFENAVDPMSSNITESIARRY